MRSSDDTKQDEFDRSRGGWMLLWRLYLWSRRNCGADDLLGDDQAASAEDIPSRPADALA